MLPLIINFVLTRSSFNHVIRIRTAVLIHIHVRETNSAVTIQSYCSDGAVFKPCIPAEISIRPFYTASPKTGKSQLIGANAEFR
jgi:hypothetical protein